MNIEISKIENYRDFIYNVFENIDFENHFKIKNAAMFAFFAIEIGNLLFLEEKGWPTMSGKKTIGHYKAEKQVFEIINKENKIFENFHESQYYSKEFIKKIKKFRNDAVHYMVNFDPDELMEDAIAALVFYNTILPYKFKFCSLFDDSQICLLYTSPSPRD